MSSSGVDLETLHKDVIELIRPKADPVGFKFLEKKDDLKKYKVTILSKKLALCQILKLAGIYNMVLGVNSENADGCVVGNYVLGFALPPEDLSERWIKVFKYTPEIFKKLVEGIHAMPQGKYEAAIFAPLKAFKVLGLEPDGVILIANSTQAYLLIGGYFDATGNKTSSDFNGHASCEIVTMVMEGKSPWLTLPCGGARGVAESWDDELWVGMKVDQLEKTINRIKAIKMRYLPPIYEMLITTPVPEHALTKLIGRRT